MEHLEGILKLVDKELGAIEQNGKFRSREEVDTVYKLIDIAKDVYCIWDYEDGSDGYSDDGYSRTGYPYHHGIVYDDGRSYSRGRGKGVKRDSMGRYSKDGAMPYHGGMNYRGYSREDGNREYIDELREMMENAPDENTRQSIQRMIAQMEHS